MESEHKTLLIDVENFKKSMSLLCHNLSQRMGDSETKQNMHSEIVLAKMDRFAAVSVDKKTFAASSAIHADLCKENAKVINQHRNYVETTLQELRGRQSQAIEALRGQLMPLINHVDPSKAEMQEQLLVYRQDFESLKKETTELKLAFFSVQQKFACVVRAEKQQEGVK